MEEILLVSKCLLGYPCRYDGKAKEDPRVVALSRRKRCIGVCPEQLGGLSTPRMPCEIIGGDGEDVLRGCAFVKTKTGADFTKAYITGAELTVELARQFGVKKAVLKAKSPSCGSCGVYDGSFTRTLRMKDAKPDGLGVTCALLRREGIKVLSENELPDK